MKKLNQISINSCQIISGFSHQLIARKLITMGVVPGKEIEIIRKGPFNSTFFVRVEDSFFAIRKVEAENILIED